MGLCLFSGPSWEEDSLNEFNENSIQSNAKEMLRYSAPWLVKDLYEKPLPITNLISRNLEYSVKNN